MKLERLIKNLDNEINKIYDEYSQLHKELDPHRGKPIDDTNLKEVNRLLKAIQDKFAELHPAIHFISYRYGFCVNALKAYNEFVEHLKKAGAIDDRNDAQRGEK